MLVNCSLWLITTTLFAWGYVMKLFVSYSRDDKNFVYTLVEKLRNEAEHDVWIDRELNGGQLWWDTILDNIEACECFIVVLTPHNITSVYCAAELNYALALHKVILPLLLKPCDIPQALREINYINISSLLLNETFLRSAHALLRLEASLLRREYASQVRPLRPPVPEAKVDTLENIYEVFVAAEEAAAEDNISLAENLYQKVMKADPQGLGNAAAERLAQIRRQHDCATAYMHIVRLVERGLTSGAKAAWHDYVQKYGTDHDPNNYIAILSEVQVAPSRTTPLPPKSALGSKTHAQLQLEPVEKESESRSQILIAPEPSIQQDSEQEAVRQEETETTVPTQRDEKPMRLISASKFIFGNGEIRELPAFYIDTWPVTNAEYRRFIQENNISPPSTWRRGKFPQEKADHPVVGVSWYEALAYAQWAGKRLPTAAEWEKAARGTDGRCYPWGKGFDVQRCNTSESGNRTTTPVKQYQAGASMYGALDMAGNVWEWTLDEIKLRGMGKNQETKRILKGGSWKTPKGSAECAAETSALPTERLEDVGFRCVRSLDNRKPAEYPGPETLET